MRPFLLFFSFLIFFNGLKGQDIDNLETLRKSSESDTKLEKTAPVDLYLIFNNKGDTIHVDTTLTIKKHYKFNYLRKDNFEKLKFSNFGQTYNSLTYNYLKSSLPAQSFSSKQHAYISSDDVNYYNVPTPLTELLFKTVMKQGQFTNAMFSTNMSENFNFSIGFNGMRSLGNYQNILSGLKMFTFTSNFVSNNNKYEFKLHYVSQNFENQENGGLTASSISNFESEDNLFSERSKLSVKFENAQSHYLSKRFFIDHKFNLFKSKKNNSLYLGHVFEYDTTYSSFDQSNPSLYYGTATELIKDKTQIKTLSNKFYTNLDSNFFGNIKLSFQNYNYDYLTNSLSDISEGFKENENLISFDWNRSFFNHLITGKISKSLFGSRLGDLVDLRIESPNSNYSVGLTSINKHPGFYYELFDSTYDEVGWNSKVNQIKINDLSFKLNLTKIGSFEINYTIIDNFTYFKLVEEEPISDDGDLKLIPKTDQSISSINYFKLKWHKEFKFGKFALDNSIVLQKVDQDESVLNIPDFLTRNTFYYSDDIFDRNLFIQTGFSIKYFSDFYANEYNPLISSFHTQQSKRIGNFPLIDFFINAKIQRTRLYLKAEHLNSSITGNDFYSSPSYPYRDFIIRFGLVWNFFN